MQATLSVAATYGITGYETPGMSRSRKTWRSPLITEGRRLRQAVPGVVGISMQEFIEQ
jgi:hypothetical protein